MVVNLNTWDVARIAWDDGSLPCCWALGLHVVVGSPIEVVVGPGEELLLLELLRGTGVRETELRVLFKHTHLFVGLFR